MSFTSNKPLSEEDKRKWKEYFCANGIPNDTTKITRDSVNVNTIEPDNRPIILNTEGEE